MNCPYSSWEVQAQDEELRELTCGDMFAPSEQSKSGFTPPDYED